MARLQDIDVKGKKVLVRVDFNVPLDKDYKITDDTRMVKALPTIKHLLENDAAVVLMSHLGRPQKKKKDDGSIDVEKFSLKHLVTHLEELTGVQVAFSPTSVGGDAEVMKDNLKSGQILLLENTRFHAGETKGDEEYAQLLSRMGDIYVNDAFGTAHRSHSSTAVVAQFFEPKDKALGMLMQAEIDNADKVVMNPKRPMVAIVGGAKVSDKILLLEKLIETANMVLVGGGMAYTFIKAQGGYIGNSLHEDELIDTAKKILAKAKEIGTEIYLPVDSAVANDFKNDADRLVVNSNEIPEGWMGLDIGPKAIAEYKSVIAKAQTIVWNGPQGVFEMSNFADGTLEIAKAVAEATQNGAFSLIGGGDSVAAINHVGLADKVSFISTGGGAMLEYLEGKKLPGIKAIKG